MRATLHWSEEAREDLFEIYLTIGWDSEAAADRVTAAIEDHAALLITNPRLGVRRPAFGSGIRVLIEGFYVIYYRTLPDTDDGPIDEVEVLRVKHGRGDLSRLF